MTITDRVQGAFLEYESRNDDARLIRLAPNAPPSRGPTRRLGRPWTHEEHDRFLHAMELYPSGPWKEIAAYVGTRTTRQTMTHAQKYRQKIERWKRGVTIKPTATATAAATDSAMETTLTGMFCASISTKEVHVDPDRTNEDVNFSQKPRGVFDESKTNNCPRSIVSPLHDSQ